MRRDNKLILNDIEQYIINKTWQLPLSERTEMQGILAKWCINGILLDVGGDDECQN